MYIIELLPKIRARTNGIYAIIILSSWLGYFKLPALPGWKEYVQKAKKSSENQ
jgi:hypothetical protein